MDLERQAEAFCEASIRDWTGRAARMLAASPELAGYSFATAVVLGDADRVRAEIARDPGLATRVDAPDRLDGAARGLRLTVEPARPGPGRRAAGRGPAHAADTAGMAKMALAAPISQDDTEGVRLLLEAGADPRRYADDDGRPASAAYEAVQSDWR